jgi:ComF family protein
MLNAQIKADFFYTPYFFRRENEIQVIIHSLKYQGMKGIGIFLGKSIYTLLTKVTFFTDNEFDFIIPVPLHKTKYRDRGYNQSEQIGIGLSQISEIPLKKDILFRNRNTKSQTHLSIEERKKNVNNAFSMHSDFKDIIKNKNIILVDDVITSGSTMMEAVKPLRKAGVNKILCIAIAMAA